MQRQFALATLFVSLAAGPFAATYPAPVLALSTAPTPVLGTGLPYQVGIASWYGADFQGHETTSGERFDMYAMTAAHRELPFGTRVRVTNLSNRRSVVLRINDRGPVPMSRVIDLSFGAARALGFAGSGLVPVRIDILPTLLPGPSR